MTVTRTFAFAAFATLLAAFLAATCAEARVLVERDGFSSSPSNVAPYGEQGSRSALGDGAYRSRADALAGPAQSEDDEDLPLEELVDAQASSESRDDDEDDDEDGDARADAPRDDDDDGDADEATAERSPRSSSAKTSGDFEDEFAAKEQSRVVGKIELDAEQARAKLPPPFPPRWGPPPRAQTKDYVELPGGYGFGSSTLKGWIEKHMAEDSREGADQTFAEAPAPASFEAFSSAEASAPASAPSPSSSSSSSSSASVAVWDADFPRPSASSIRAAKTHAEAMGHADAGEDAGEDALTPTLRDSIVEDHRLSAATIRGFGADARSCGASGGVALVTVWGTVPSNVTDALVAMLADDPSEDETIAEEEWSSTWRGVGRRVFRVAGVYRASFGGGDSEDDRRACVANFFVNSKLAAERTSPGSKSGGETRETTSPARLRDFFLREVLPEDDERGDHDATVLALAVNCDASRRVKLLWRMYGAVAAKFGLTKNDLHLSAGTKQVEEDAAALLGFEPERVAELRRDAAANPWVGDATNAVAVAKPACPELAAETDKNISGGKGSAEEAAPPETFVKTSDETFSNVDRASSAKTNAKKTSRDDDRDEDDVSDEHEGEASDDSDDASDDSDDASDSEDGLDDEGFDSAFEIRERFESRREERRAARVARRASRGEEDEDVPLEALVDGQKRGEREDEEDEDEYRKR